MYRTYYLFVSKYIPAAACEAVAAVAGSAVTAAVAAYEAVVACAAVYTHTQTPMARGGAYTRKNAPERHSENARQRRESERARAQANKREREHEWKTRKAQARVKGEQKTEAK